MNEIEERQKGLTELGARARAGTLMSSLFRAVASECTELINIPVPNSKTGQMEKRLVSKAEAIVRDIIRKALPRTINIGDEDIEIPVDSKVQLEYRKLILDRIDGRVTAIGEDNKGQGESIPAKVSRLNKDFLNEQAKKTKERTGPPKV
jgi:hypothetical protein